MLDRPVLEGKPGLLLDQPMTLFRAALLLAFAMPSWPSPVVAEPAPSVLVPHRAVYDLKLIRSEGNKAPSDAKGRIAFDFSGTACEGYSQNFRQLTQLQGAEGPMRTSDMRSATFEDGDGKNFRFKVETDVDRGKVETVDGRAARSADGGLSVNLTQPKLTKLDLARDVVFPTEHLRRVIGEAKSGHRLLAIKVYDGSDSGAKVFDTTTVIGKPITGAVDDAAADVSDLTGMTRWPVAISYFEEGKADSQPNYTLSFELYENGISRELKLDYGDFTLLGHMVKLDLLPTKACRK